MIAKDKKLYEIVKKEADAKFLAPTSAYKSAWIVRIYKSRGGIFESKPDPKQGLTRWFSEKWVDLNRDNKPYGRAKATLNGTYPLCRPSIRITDKTPRLASEISDKSIEKAKAGVKSRKICPHA
jgi:hypothetical protein